MSYKKGIIFSKGNYPIGGSELRTRMFNYGFIANGIPSKIIIAHPAPTEENYRNSESFVYFSFKPEKNQSGKLISVLRKLLGNYRGYLYLKRNKDVAFVLLYGLGFIEGFFVNRFCKKNGIKFFAEKCDEHRKMYWEDKLTIIDQLAKYNQIFFDKYILPKVDVLFVVSSYFEKKYKEITKNLKIKRSVPALIDYVEFRKMQSNDIFEIDNDNINIFKSKKKKVVYSGSCSFTNGLYFFLECAAEILKKKKLNFEIIFLISSGNVTKIRNFCEKLKIQDNITILEKILPKHIPAIYKHSDILVLPEMGDIVANAGFPGKTAEYLASGKPIISTIFSDLTDYLKHEYNTMLSPTGEHKTYTDNLERLILDKDLRNRLGKNGVQTALKYFDYKRGVLPFIEELQL